MVLRGPRPFVYPLAALALFLASIGLQISHGAIFYQRWVQDIFIPFEGVLHMRAGDRPNVDFSTPIGPLYYQIHYLAAEVFSLSGRTVIYANAIVGLFAVGMVLWFSRFRLPAWAASLAALHVGMSAISPRQLGATFKDVTYNASYNRYGWALVGVLAIVTMLPRPKDDKSGELLDGLLIGLLLTGLFYLKISYFLAGGVLVGCSLFTTRRTAPWRYALIAGAAFAILVAAVELSTGVTAPYLNDLMSTAAAQTSLSRLRELQLLSVYSYVGCLLVLVIGLLRRREGGFMASVFPMAGAMLIVFAGVVIGVQNHLALENPLLPLAALVAWFAGAPVNAAPQVPDAAFEAPRLRVAALVGIVGLFLLGLGQDALSSVWTAVAPRSRAPEIAWLRSTPLRDVELAREDNRWSAPGVRLPPELQNDVEYFYVLSDGVSLLRPYLMGSRKAVVLPLTWNNPFPTLLDLPPPEHELAWWDAGRSFSAEHKPAPKQLLEGVDFVMIPSAYYNFDSAIAMRAAYASDVAADFAEVGRSRFWILLARRNPAPSQGPRPALTENGAVRASRSAGSVR